MHDVLVRAAPSAIHGVGVFAVTPIALNARVQLWSEEELRFIAKPVDGYLAEMVRTYGVEVNDGYWCPKDFNRCEIGWYINHSADPNMTYADDVTLVAVRKIGRGEELTVNYAEINGQFRDPRYARVRRGAQPGARAWIQESMP
jgi:hypothetical protein